MKETKESTGSFYRDTWIEVNRKNIYENVLRIKGALPKDVEFLATLKADGYGHGSLTVAQAALQAGATYFGVATLNEALLLREEGIDTPIIVLGYIPPRHVKIALENKITVVVFQSSWIEEAAQELEGSPNPLSCHIKLDTGMGRIGIRTKEEGNALIKEVKKYPDLFHIEGMYTHFATADEMDNNYFNLQYERFERMLHFIEERLDHQVDIKHCGNSAAALRFPSKCFNMARVGIAMYGLSPSEEMKKTITVPLKEAFSLHSKIIHVKKIPKGEGVSYGATYKTKDEEWIATVPIGYADGWIRANSPGEVLIEGKRYPIVGRICMDQMMVTTSQAFPINTKVTLIGRQGNEYISVDEVAKRLQTINYEIPITISSRVPRIVVDEGEK